MFLKRLRYKALYMIVIVLQSHVRGWLARREAKRLREERRALVVLQAHFRGCLVRRRMKPELDALKEAVYKERLRKWASLKIQSVWRGYQVRRQIKSKKLHKVRRRISELSCSANEGRTLGSRMGGALSYLLRSDRDVAYILEAVMGLEVSTRLSPECCERLAQVDAVPALYALIRGCNRSVPHMEILRHTVDTLLNMAKYERTSRIVLPNPGSVATLLDLMTIYREKGPLFYRTCMLLGVLGLDHDHRRMILAHPPMLDTLQSIYSLTLRKHKASQSRQTTKTKMATYKSLNCTMPAMTATTPAKKKRVRPQWVLARNTIQDFDDSLTAINFVMNVLHVGPKI